MFYEKELRAINKKQILRRRELFPSSYIDFASNDYLGLSYNEKLITKAYELVKDKKLHAPRASMLINGYSKLHLNLENMLSRINKFEKCILVGSGFLANIALFETLCRNNDRIFIDEEYHASGILASRLLGNKSIFFKHNDVEDLKTKIKENILSLKNGYRIIIAIEGVYSMYGDLGKKEFMDIAEEYNAILIVDEAHSVGTIGENLLGYFDYYKCNNMPNNIIKLGTLSKAYGSYGAYILGSKHIIEYLETRAKPIIYSTALSQFDTALAIQNIKYVQNNKKRLYNKIMLTREVIKKELGVTLNSQIFSIQFQEQTAMLRKAISLKQNNIIVGKIRKPTVSKPLLRIVLSTKHNKKDISKLCKLLKS